MPAVFSTCIVYWIAEGVPDWLPAAAAPCQRTSLRNMVITESLMFGQKVCHERKHRISIRLPLAFSYSILRVT